jgi:hypothetical protein
MISFYKFIIANLLISINHFADYLNFIHYFVIKYFNLILYLFYF